MKNRRSISRRVKNTSERARVVEETAVVVLLTGHWKELEKHWGKQLADEAEGALGRKHAECVRR